MIKIAKKYIQNYIETLSSHNNCEIFIDEFNQMNLSHLSNSEMSTEDLSIKTIFSNNYSEITDKFLFIVAKTFSFNFIFAELKNNAPNRLVFYNNTDKSKNTVELTLSSFEETPKIFYYPILNNKIPKILADTIYIDDRFLENNNNNNRKLEIFYSQKSNYVIENEGSFYPIDNSNFNEELNVCLYCNNENCKTEDYHLDFKLCTSCYKMFITSILNETFEAYYEMLECLIFDETTLNLKLIQSNYFIT